MSHATNHPSNASSLVGSERVRLARAARAVALGTSGVVGMDAGPMGLLVTEGGGERLEGVTCVATSQGGYEVSLGLVCELVPLLALGARIKTGVERAAATEGIALESVSVHVAEIREPGAL